ncbi:4'-phosphopantetheinyl transferase family protein [Rhizobium terrae]|uniref:4'-phosphopantetheinyl transferase family protein n=1 Tax=Rhizobium terrae TaxID=2171756 RepID=UPI000E3D2A58|nr:4'-phosphopantetheinyl transferase superfamily protein [Rhizobium terrae]
MLFEGIFDPFISVAESALSADFPALFPEEQTAIAGAMTRRQREFIAGRTCARQAMNGLGLADMPIPMGVDRAPIWPGGVTGSISHSTTRCAAVAARHSDGIKALGIDLEEAAPLDEALAEDICTLSERIWLERQQPFIRGLLLTAIFSAKECAYKCQYPLSHAIFGYDAVRVELKLAEESFTACFETDIAPFRTFDRLDGRIAFRRGYIVAGMMIR